MKLKATLPGGELQVAKSAGIVRVDNRVINEIPWMKMESHDGPDLGGNCPGLPVVVIDAELEIGCIEEGVVMSVGSCE